MTARSQFIAHERRDAVIEKNLHCR
jgi:hypothetical protein